MKNKWAAVAVCSGLLFASIGYYFYHQNARNGSDVMGIEKNWWDDPNSQEEKWVKQFEDQYALESNPKVKEEQEQESDQYQDMVQLKTRHSQRYGQIKANLASLQSRLQNASSPQEAADIKNEIAKQKEQFKEMKEDDQFIQLITGH